MEKSSNRRFGVRTVAAIVAGLMVGGMCTAMTASAADDSAAGYSATAPVNLTRPATVPSMDGWTDGTGAWTLGEGTRVVSSDALAARAQSLASELTKFTDVDIKAATGSATGKDISLTLDASKKAELGDEGFKLSIGSKGLEVIGATDIGVFYGTRSVSQMLRQGQLTLPAGTVATKPKYKERGATLCACQINISTDWIDRFLSDMADLRLNYVLLEMKLKPEEDNTKKAATWSYYTRDDVKKFVEKANNYGIDVIPEINSPGHMNIWLENYPEYQLADNSGRKDPNKLDISNPEAVKFYKTLIDEYDGVFTTKYWHMGADEYMIGSSFDNYSKLKTFAEERYGAGATPNDAFTGFINDIDKYVKAKGKQLRIWNDGIVNTKNVSLNKDIVIEYWYGAGRKPQELVQDGYTLMNATQTLYWSRSAQVYKVNAARLYNNKNWNVGTFDGGRQIDKNYDKLTGAKVSIWPDSSIYQTENEVEKEIFDGMRFISQMTWSDSRPWATWNDMKADIDKIGYPLDIREYDYTPVDAGIYDIPQLKSISKGPWELVTTPDGYYQMKDTVSGKCLALFTGSKHLDVVTQVGATPELRNCADVSVGQDQRNTANERNTQKWQIRADKDGKYTISPALTQQRLAIATGNEQNIDLETHRPAAGTVAQFPADLVSDNALFTLTGHMGMSATVDSKTVNPASPSKITVKVRAASNANTGDVTVTPVVPEGWEIKPGSVSLKSIPAGKAAIAYFNVVNTTGTGDATVQFKLTNTKTGEELGTTSVALTGSLTKDVEASDYAASSQETTGEHAPVGNAFDKNANTFWHSKYSNPSANLPHWLAFKASPGEGNKIAAITHLYRQDKLNGPAKNVAVYVVAASTANSVADVTNWGEPVATAKFPYTKELQTIPLPNTIPSGDVYVKFQINDAWGLSETSAGVTWAAVAELAATAKATPVELTEPEQPKDNPEVTETPEATGVTVSGDGVADGALSLKKGTTAQLTAKVAPDDADQAVTWASSDDKVVTVDKTGKVTAVAKGVAKVTATTANGKSASVAVTVTEDSEVPGPTGPTEPTKPGTEKPTTKPTTKPNDGKLSATGADTAVLATIAALFALAGGAVVAVRRRSVR